MFRFLVRLAAVLALGVAALAVGPPALANTPPVTAANLTLTASDGTSVCCTTIQAYWGYYSHATQIKKGVVANNTARNECVVTNRIYLSTGDYLRFGGGTIPAGQLVQIMGYWPAADAWSPYDPLRWSVSLADCNRPGLGGSAATTSGNGD